MEDDLDARQLVRVVTEEEEAIVSIHMVMQHLHNCFNNNLNNIGFLNQLSGLKEETDKERYKNRDEKPHNGMMNPVVSKWYSIHLYSITSFFF